MMSSRAICRVADQIAAAAVAVVIATAIADVITIPASAP